MFLKVNYVLQSLTYLLTPWSRVLLEKLTGFAANQEIPRILWNPKVHYCTHKRPHVLQLLLLLVVVVVVVFVLFHPNRTLSTILLKYNIQEKRRFGDSPPKHRGIGTYCFDRTLVRVVLKYHRTLSAL